MILCMAGGAMCSLNVMGCYPLVPAYFAALYLEQVSKDGAMKKTGLRQMILCMAGGAMCSLNVMGCYPLVPAYFAALYLEQVSAPMLLGMMYIGIFLFMPLTALVPAYFAALYLEQVSAPMLLGMMYIGIFLFMPLTAGVKYAMVLLVVRGAIRLIEWANGGCPAFMAAFLSAAATVIISFAGGLLEWKNQPEMAAVILEGVFICGAVILLGRAMHLVLNWRFEPRETEKNRLIEWANGGCPAFMAAFLSAAATVIISFAGGLLEWKNQPEMAAVILEGVFICGAVILLGRAMHLVLNWRFEPRETEKKERGNEERLRGYAESFQGLSQVFYTMSNRKEAYDAGELGQIQNELTGKICANCDSCALCWERDSAPLEL